MTRVVEAKLRLSAEDKTAAGLNSAAARLKAFEAKAAAMDRAARAAAQGRRIEDRAQQIAARSRQAQVAGAITAGARVAAPYIGAAALAKSFTDFAKFDRQMTNIGITADATREEMERAGEAVRKIASDAATPIGDVAGGLETLVAAGRKLPEAMAFLPTVTKTALATNAAVDDIAKTADAMGASFKIAGADMERAFDVAAFLGNEGRFELKDQSRYLPSIAPLAATRGLLGIEGLTHVGAALQVIQKNAGTAEEAAASMTDVLGKIDTDETIKRMSKEFGIDLPKSLTKAKKAGQNTFDTFIAIAERAVGGDMEKVNRIFGDKEARRGLTALLQHREEYRRLIAKAAEAGGTIADGATRKLTDAQAAVHRLGNAFNGAAVATGRLLDAAGVTTFLEGVATKAGAASVSLQDLSEKVRDLGTVDGVVQWLAVGPSATSPEAKAALATSQTDPDSFFSARYHSAPPASYGVWGWNDPASREVEELRRRQEIARSYPLPEWVPSPGIPDSDLQPLRHYMMPQPRPRRPGERGGVPPLPRERPDPFDIKVQLDDASMDAEVMRMRARLQSSLDAQPLIIRTRAEPAKAPLDTGRSFKGGDFSGAP